MAKRPQLATLKHAVKITGATEPRPIPGQPEPAAPDRTAVVSVGLKQSEITRLSEIAMAAGVTRNNLMNYALKQFLKDYDAGKIDLSKELKTIKRL